LQFVKELTVKLLASGKSYVENEVSYFGFRLELDVQGFLVPLLQGVVNRKREDREDKCHQPLT